MKVLLSFIFCLFVSISASGENSYKSALSNSQIIVWTSSWKKIYTFPHQVQIHKVSLVENSKQGDRIVVVALCKEEVSKDALWYFEFDNGGQGSKGPTQLGVQPPRNATISRVQYFFGDTFGFIFDVPNVDQKTQKWYYVTSCPPGGIDSMGGIFQKDAKHFFELFDRAVSN